MPRAAETYSVSPRTLFWARTRLGLDPAAVAERVRVPLADFLAIEAGGVEPTIQLLDKLATIYHVSFTTLLAPKPPEDRDLPTDFRTLDGQRPDLSPDSLAIIRQVQHEQESFSELLADLEEDVTVDVPRVELGTNVERLAEQERAHLGVTDRLQLEWRSVADAFRTWRGRIEALGVLVFARPLPRDECRGFSSWPAPLLPLITVSSREVDQAKIFTLLHEYGHLLLRRPGVCDERTTNQVAGSANISVEVFCNRFAASTLLPRSVVLAAIAGSRLPSEPEWDVEAVRSLARRLKVSAPALALRLEALGMADEGLYGAIIATSRDWITGAGGPVPISTQVLNRFGVRYVGAVLEAVDRGITDRVSADEFFRVPGTHLAQIRETFRERSVAYGE